MSKHPAGFKTQEDYNAYMRDYKAKRRAEQQAEAKKYYYIEVYQATADERNIYSTILTDILKTLFECLRLLSEAEKAAGISESLPSREHIITIKTDQMPKEISVSTNQEPLIPFYQRVAEKFIETYGSQIDQDLLFGNVRVYQHFTLEQLKEELQRLQNLKRKNLNNLTFLIVHNASKILKNTLGHPDSGEQIRKLSSIHDSREKSEQLYLEAMLLLKREGLGYFEADLASAKLAFPFGKDDDPYIFFENGSSHPLHSLDRLQVHSNSALLEWFEREKAETETKREIWLEEYYKEQQEQAIHNDWRNKVREWLVKFIENDGDAKELLVEMQRTKQSESEQQEITAMYEELKKVTPRKVIRFKPIDDGKFEATL